MLLAFAGLGSSPAYSDAQESFSSIPVEAESVPAEAVAIGAQPGAARHLLTLAGGIAGASLVSWLAVAVVPNWDDADERSREERGLYVGAPVGAVVGVWVEGERTGSVRWWAPVVGSLVGFGVAAAHAESSEGDSMVSYAALVLLPPLGATILHALTEPDPGVER